MTIKTIVTIGGGTGQFVVLRGLKKVAQDISLRAIVSMTDSGGSTGRLRDEFGLLPVGDARKALVALSDKKSESALRALFMYRFKAGTGLNGHNLGNLFLVALSDLYGSEEKAIEVASQILRVKGKVIPVSNDSADLVAQYEDGSEVIGEATIDEPKNEHDGRLRIRKLSLSKPAKISEGARYALREADCIVLGPGDLYTSHLANMVVDGMPEALVDSKGIFVYVVNLMTRYGQTYGMSAVDHVREVERYSGRMPDMVLMNSTSLPADVLTRYEEQKAKPVVDDLSCIENKCTVIRGDFLAQGTVERVPGDTLRRSLLRHDEEKLARAIIGLA